MEPHKWIRICQTAFFIGAFLALFFIILFLFTGCRSKQELDELGIVSGVAVDTDRGSADPVEVTAQVVCFSSGGSGQEGSSGPAGAWNLNLQGSSVLDAIRKSLNQSNRHLFFSHNQVLIFGRETARQGLRAHIDFFIRDYEARMNVPLVIADGSGAELLSAVPDNAVLSAEFIRDLISLQKRQGDCVDTRVYQFAQNLAAWEKGTLAALVGVREENGKAKPVITGTAVLKNDTMVGVLDAIAARGVSWVMGTVEEGTLTVTAPQGQVTVNITEAGVSRKITFDSQGRMHVLIQVNQTGLIGHAEGSAGNGDPQNIREIQTAVEQEIEKEIRIGKEKLVAFGCDAYGFGDYLRRFQHKTWEQARSRWDVIFQEMIFDIEVRSDINNTGALEENV